MRWDLLNVRRAQQINGTLHQPLLIFSITRCSISSLTFATNRILGWVEEDAHPEMIEAQWLHRFGDKRAGADL